MIKKVERQKNFIEDENLVNQIVQELREKVSQEETIQNEEEINDYTIVKD